MAETGRRWERHPLCTCPPDTWARAPDRQPCRDRAMPLDPHPALTIEDLREMSDLLRDQVLIRRRDEQLGIQP